MEFIVDVYCNGLYFHKLSRVELTISKPIHHSVSGETERSFYLRNRARMLEILNSIFTIVCCIGNHVFKLSWFALACINDGNTKIHSFGDAQQQQENSNIFPSSARDVLKIIQFMVNMTPSFELRRQLCAQWFWDKQNTSTLAMWSLHASLRTETFRAILFMIHFYDFPPFCANRTVKNVTKKKKGK